MPNRDCVAHELLIDFAPGDLSTNEPFDVSHESRRGRSSGKIDERKLAIGPRIDLDLVALEEAPFEHQKCQWILDEALNRSLQRTCPERLIVTLCRKLMLRRRCQLDRQFSLRQQLIQLPELKTNDVLDLLFTKRLEDDDVVNAIEKLRTEVLTQRTCNLSLHQSPILRSVLEGRFLEGDKIKVDAGVNGELTFLNLPASPAAT